ncbi:MAG: DedA family protein [Acetobacteraceae bacterium]|nr:DedA family protein [Acetobacteraceae bacterium]
MGSWFGQVVDLIGGDPWIATTVAFAAAVIEAVAILGMLIPGTYILMAVAGAVAMAGLPITPILIVSVLGAVIGDGISFWVGYRYRDRLAGMWPFRSRPELLATAHRFFARYGAMSVALCRFIPVLRSTVPLVAGMAGMPKGRFLLANIASALVWAPAHVLPAQFAGLSIERLREGDWRDAALLGLIVLGAAGALFALHRLAASANVERWFSFRRRPSGEKQRP